MKNILITGGLGFIGSSIANKLRENTNEEILIVDSFKNGKKFMNLNFYDRLEFVDSHKFYNHYLNSLNPKNVKAIFHQGACTNTTEWDGELVLNKNLNNSIFKVSIDNLLNERYERPITYSQDGRQLRLGFNRNF